MRPTLFQHTLHPLTNSLLLAGFVLFGLPEGGFRTKPR